MKFRMSAVRTLLFFPIISCSGLVLADSFDQAVNEYIKGYKECTEANTLSRTDLKAAQKKFAIYLSQLKRATAIDKSILTSNKRDMDANLRYCERVENTLKKMEATPILEEGLVACDAAQKSLDAGEIAKAQTEFEQFNQSRNKALEVTDTLMEVFSLSSQVRSCDRLGEKINAAVAKHGALSDNMALAIKDATSNNATCQQAKASLSASNFNLNNLTDATNLLDKSTEMTKKLKQSAAPLLASNDASIQTQKQQLGKLMADIDSCNAQSTKLAQGYTNTKNAAEKDVKNALSQLGSAQKSCDLAKQAGGRASSPADISEAKNQHSNSVALMKKATDKDTLESVKKLSGTTLVGNYNKALSSLESCQRSALQTITTKDSAIAASLKQEQEKELQAQKAQEAQKAKAAEAAQAAPPPPEPKAPAAEEKVAKEADDKAAENPEDESKPWSKKVNQFRP